MVAGGVTVVGAGLTLLKVQTISQGVLEAMFIQKMKTAAVVAAVSVTGTVGTVGTVSMNTRGTTPQTVAQAPRIQKVVQAPRSPRLVRGLTTASTGPVFLPAGLDLANTEAKTVTDETSKVSATEPLADHAKDAKDMSAAEVEAKVKAKTGSEARVIIPLSTTGPQVKAEPESRGNGEKISPAEEARLRLIMEEVKKGQKAHFGELYYPNIEFAAIGGISGNLAKEGGYTIHPLTTFTASTTDDIRKVWDYYVDNVPALDTIENRKATKRRMEHSDYNLGNGPNHPATGFTSTQFGLNGESNYGSLNLNGQIPQGKIVCQRSDQTIVITLLALDPEKAPKGRHNSEHKTSIEIIKMLPLEKPADSAVKTITTENTAR
jgi:hypothetical protein